VRSAQEAFACTRLCSNPTHSILWYPHTWGATRMHFHVHVVSAGLEDICINFNVASVYSGSSAYAFGHGICIVGRDLIPHSASWYRHTWGALSIHCSSHIVYVHIGDICIHFDVVSMHLGSPVYAVNGLRVPQEPCASYRVPTYWGWSPLCMILILAIQASHRLTR
jgi:hypothetical protein